MQSARPRTIGWHASVVLLGVLLFGLFTVVSSSPAAAQDTASPTIDARIGGSVVTFEAKYGAPTNSPTNDVAAKHE